MIKVEEVRKGDTITVTWTTRDVKRAVTGVAYYQDSDGDWRTQSEVYLTDMCRAEQLIRLDNRPRPQPPTGPGSILLTATLVDGRTVGPLFLGYDGDWLKPTPSAEWAAPEDIVDFTIGKIVAAE